MSSGDERAPLLLPGTRGRTTVIKASTRRNTACIMILIAELFERIACYSLAGNLVFFLSKEPLCWNSALATAAELIFTAVMFIVGLFAGWLSDSYLGRYRTIITGYAIYALGYIYLPILTNYSQHAYVSPNSTSAEGTPCNSSWQDTETPVFCNSSFDGSANCCVTMFISIVLVAIGAGVVRTNLAPFGGDQAKEGGTKFTEMFFNGYYWAINVGCFLALVGVAIIQEKNFFYGFLVSLSALVLSFVAFIAGTKFYISRPAGDINVFRSVFALIRNAYQVRRDNDRFRYTVPTFLDYANMEHEGGEFSINEINDVKRLWKISKVFLLLIPYWICYSQMNYSIFLLQGYHLRIDFEKNISPCPKGHTLTSVESPTATPGCNLDYNSTGNFDNHDVTVTFPPTSIAIFNNVFIILALPLVQRFYLCLSAHNVQLLTWRRLWLGMFLASLALVCGGIVEYVRMRDINECGFVRQLIGNTVYEASPGISMFWQIPQYSLLGASEVFLIVTGIEYAYMESPGNMQGVVMGMFWCAGGIGYFIGVALPYIFQHIDAIWINPVYINCNKIDLYFFILAGFLFLFSFIFVGISKYADLGLTNVIVGGRTGRFTSESTSLPNTPRTRRRRRTTIQQPVNPDLTSFHC